MGENVCYRLRHGPKIYGPDIDLTQRNAMTKTFDQEMPELRFNVIAHLKILWTSDIGWTD